MFVISTRSLELKILIESHLGLFSAKNTIFAMVFVVLVLYAETSNFIMVKKNVKLGDGSFRFYGPI